MEQMLERCVTIMSEEHIMPAAEARALMEETLPRLKRWSQEHSHPLAQYGSGTDWSL